MYIEEQKVESIQQAARLTHKLCNYSLIHLGSFEGSTVDLNSTSVVKAVLSKSASVTPATFAKSNSKNQQRSMTFGPICTNVRGMSLESVGI